MSAVDIHYFTGAAGIRTRYILYMNSKNGNLNTNTVQLKDVEFFNCDVIDSGGECGFIGSRYNVGTWDVANIRIGSSNKIVGVTGNSFAMRVYFDSIADISDFSISPSGILGYGIFLSDFEAGLSATIQDGIIAGPLANSPVVMYPSTDESVWTLQRINIDRTTSAASSDIGILSVQSFGTAGTVTINIHDCAVKSHTANNVDPLVYAVTWDDGNVVVNVSHCGVLTTANISEEAEYGGTVTINESNLVEASPHFQNMPIGATLAADNSLINGYAIGNTAAYERAGSTTFNALARNGATRSPTGYKYAATDIIPIGAQYKLSANAINRQRTYTNGSDQYILYVDEGALRLKKLFRSSILSMSA